MFLINLPLARGLLHFGLAVALGGVLVAALWPNDPGFLGNLTPAIYGMTVVGIGAAALLAGGIFVAVACAGRLALARGLAIGGLIAWTLVLIGLALFGTLTAFDGIGSARRNGGLAGPVVLAALPLIAVWAVLFTASRAAWPVLTPGGSLAFAQLGLAAASTAAAMVVRQFVY